MRLPKRILILCGSAGTLLFGTCLLLYFFRSSEPTAEMGVPFGGHDRHNLMAMMKNNEVKAELNLTDKERDEVDRIFEAAEAEIAAMTTPDIRNMSLEEIKAWESNQKNHERQIYENTKIRMKSMMAADKWTRLQQLNRQRRGLMVLLDPEVQDTLQLSRAQREKIREISQDPNRFAEMLDVLTAIQKQRLAELLGRPKRSEADNPTA